MKDGNSRLVYSNTDIEDFVLLWNTLSNKEKKSLLFNMLEGGLVSKLHHLARNGFDLVDCDEDGSNLLHHASFSDNPDVIECLVYIGCDISKQDSFGRTPLHIASSHGNLNSLKTLLQYQKQWFQKDKLGNTFLNTAKEGYKLKIYLLSLLVFIKNRIFHL
ncbi:MAG: ubiquitin-protein ligase mib1 isoform [Bacteroidota bacterium]|jgi:ankyrin repeat protein